MAKRGSFGGKRFTRGSATGTPSNFGRSAASRSASRRLLNPWGNAVPSRSGRNANAVGTTPFRSKVRTTGIRQPTPARSLFGMDYRNGDPVAWPLMGKGQAGTGLADSIIGLPSGPDSGMTSDKADFNNKVVNHAFQRGGYAG